MLGLHRLDEAQPISRRRALGWWAFFALLGWGGVLGALALLRSAALVLLP